MTASRRPSRAFTLVELLVVIGIIVVVVSLLLPAVASARRESRAVQCQSNVKQIATGLIAYAGVFNSRFPPNRAGPVPQHWTDADRIGQFIPLPVTTTSAPDSSVFICPEEELARRSYAMNVWASARIDGSLSTLPLKGVQWHFGEKRAAELVLLVEAWAYLGSNSTGFAPPPAVGGAPGLPGTRFGGGGGITPINTSRWGPINAEVSFARHRRASGPGAHTEPRGRTVIAYGDGHVEILSNDSLVDYASGDLTGRAYWSPLDFARRSGVD